MSAIEIVGCAQRMLRVVRCRKEKRQRRKLDLTLANDQADSLPSSQLFELCASVANHSKPFLNQHCRCKLSPVSELTIIGRLNNDLTWKRLMKFYAAVSNFVCFTLLLLLGNTSWRIASDIGRAQF